MWGDILAAKGAIMQIADREGLSFEEVTKEIDLAIEEAIKTSDEAALEKWSHIPCEGDRPTAIEFIAYMSRKLHNNYL